MALVKGTNSFVDVAEANAYFADKISAVEWNSLANKEALLIEATAILNEMSWTGTAIDENQDLSFPRIAEYFDPRLGTYVYLDGTVIPNRIAKATCDLAIHLSRHSEVLDSDASIGDLAISTIKLTGIRPAPKISDEVMTTVRCLLTNSGAQVWWRAN